MFVFSAVASDSASAEPRLLKHKSKFVRVVFVLSAVVSDSAPAGPMLLADRFKIVRVVFVLSVVASESAPEFLKTLMRKAVALTRSSFAASRLS